MIEPIVVGEVDGEWDQCSVKLRLLLVAADRSIEKSITRGKIANLRHVTAELLLWSMYRGCRDQTYFAILSKCKWCQASRNDEEQHEIEDGLHLRRCLCGRRENEERRA